MDSARACSALKRADANARNIGFSWWLKTGGTTPFRERRSPDGLNIESTRVVATRVRGGRCEADWIGQRGEARCSLENRGCQGMVLKKISDA